MNRQLNSLLVLLVLVGFSFSPAIKTAQAQDFFIFQANAVEAESDWDKMLADKKPEAVKASDGLKNALKAYQSKPGMDTAIGVLRYYNEMSANKDLRQVFLAEKPQLFQTLDAAKYELVMQTQKKLADDGKPIGHSLRVGSSGARHRAWLKWKSEGGDPSRMPALNPDKQFQSDDDVTNFAVKSDGDMFDTQERLNGKNAAKAFQEVTKQFGSQMDPSLAQIEFLSPTAAYSAMTKNGDSIRKKYDPPTYYQAWISSNSEKYNGYWAVNQLDRWGYDQGVITTDVRNPLGTTSDYKSKYGDYSADGRSEPEPWPADDFFGWMTNQHKQVFDTHAKDLEEGRLKYLQKYTLKRMVKGWENIGMVPPTLSEGEMSKTELLKYNKDMLVSAHKFHFDLMAKELIKEIDQVRINPSEKLKLHEKIDASSFDPKTALGRSANALAVAYSNLDQETINELQADLDDHVKQISQSNIGGLVYRGVLARHLKETIAKSTRSGRQLRDQALAFRETKKNISLGVNDHLVDMSNKTIDDFLIDVARGRSFRWNAGTWTESQLTPQDVRDDLNIIHSLAGIFRWTDEDVAEKVKNYFDQDLHAGIQLIQKVHRITSGRALNKRTIRYKGSDGREIIEEFQPTGIREFTSIGVLSIKAAFKYGQDGWALWGKVNTGADLMRNMNDMIGGTTSTDEQAGKLLAQAFSNTSSLMDIGGKLDKKYPQFNKQLGTAYGLMMDAFSLANQDVITDSDLNGYARGVGMEMIKLVAPPPLTAALFMTQVGSIAWTNWTLSSANSAMIDFIVENGDWEIDPESKKDPVLKGIYLGDSSVSHPLTILAKTPEAVYENGYKSRKSGNLVHTRNELIDLLENGGKLNASEPLQIVKEAIVKQRDAASWISYFRNMTFATSETWNESFVKDRLGIRIDPNRREDLYIKDLKSAPNFVPVIENASASELTSGVRRVTAKLIAEYWLIRQQIMEDVVLKEVEKAAILKKKKEELGDLPEFAWMEALSALYGDVKQWEEKVWKEVARSTDPYSGPSYDPKTDIAITKSLRLGTEPLRTAVSSLVYFMRQDSIAEPLFLKSDKALWDALNLGSLMSYGDGKGNIKVETIEDARFIGQKLVSSLADEIDELKKVYEKILTDLASEKARSAKADGFQVGKPHVKLDGTIRYKGFKSMFWPYPDESVNAEWAQGYIDKWEKVRDDIALSNPTYFDQASIEVITSSGNDALTTQAYSAIKRSSHELYRRLFGNYFKEKDQAETHPYFPYMNRLQYQINKLTNMKAGAGEMTASELTDAITGMKLKRETITPKSVSSSAAISVYIDMLLAFMTKEYDETLKSIWDLVDLEMVNNPTGNMKMLEKYPFTYKVVEKGADLPSLTSAEITQHIHGYRWTLFDENEEIYTLTTRKPSFDIVFPKEGRLYLKMEALTKGSLPLGRRYFGMDVEAGVIEGVVKIVGQPPARNTYRFELGGENIFDLPDGAFSEVLKEVEVERLVDIGLMDEYPNDSNYKAKDLEAQILTKEAEMRGSNISNVELLRPGHLKVIDPLQIDMDKGVQIVVNVKDLAGNPIPDTKITVMDRLIQSRRVSTPDQLMLPLTDLSSIHAKVELADPRVEVTTDWQDYEPGTIPVIDVVLPIFMPGSLTIQGTIAPPSSDPDLAIVSGEVDDANGSSFSISEGGTFDWTNSEIVVADRSIELGDGKVKAKNHRLVKLSSKPMKVYVTKDLQQSAQFNTQTFDVEVDGIRISLLDWTGYPIFTEVDMEVFVDYKKSTKTSNYWEGSHTFQYDNEVIPVDATWSIPGGPVEGSIDISISQVENIYARTPKIIELIEVEMPVYQAGNLTLSGVVAGNGASLSSLSFGLPGLSFSERLPREGSFSIKPNVPVPVGSLQIEVKASINRNPVSQSKSVSLQERNGEVDLGTYSFAKPKDQTDPTAGGGTPPVTPPTPDEVIRNLGPLTSAKEQERDEAIANCKYGDAALIQSDIIQIVQGYITKVFSGAVPASLETVIQGFRGDLHRLQKISRAEEEGRVLLRQAMAAAKERKLGTTMSLIEDLAGIDNVPACLKEPSLKLYEKIENDIKEMISMIQEAGNVQCDYALAESRGLKLRDLAPQRQWVRDELPGIISLSKAQRDANDLLTTASKLASQAAAIGSKDKVKAVKLYNQAVKTAKKAGEMAPNCQKDDIRTLIEGYIAAAKSVAAQQQVPPDPVATAIDRSVLIVLDASGSMRGDKISSAKFAAIRTVKSFGPNVEVGLYVYAGGCGGHSVKHPFSTDKQSVIGAINAVTAGGSTPLSTGLIGARTYMAQNARAKSGKMILLNDGQDNCKKMTEARDQIRNSQFAVQIDAIGVGLDANADAAKDLADLVNSIPNSNFYSTSGADEMIKAFRRVSIIDRLKVDANSPDPVANSYLSEVFRKVSQLVQADRTQEAIGTLKAAANQYPKEPAVQFNLSLAYEGEAQLASAIKHGKAYVSMAPNAFDAGTVQARLNDLEEELAKNPSAIFDPSDCRDLYIWARQESRSVRNADQKSVAFKIMTEAQRGDCSAAQTNYGNYLRQYGE